VIVCLLFSRLSAECSVELAAAAFLSLRLLVEVFLKRVEFLNEAVVSKEIFGTCRFAEE
jgi:hypothetical protein